MPLLLFFSKNIIIIKKDDEEECAGITIANGSRESDAALDIDELYARYSMKLIF